MPRSGLTLRMMVIRLVQRMDFGGLDLSHKSIHNPAIQKMLTHQDYKPVKLDKLVEQGHLGLKQEKASMIIRGAVKQTSAGSVI